MYRGAEVHENSHVLLSFCVRRCKPRSVGWVGCLHRGLARSQERCCVVMQPRGQVTNVTDIENDLSAWMCPASRNHDFESGLQSMEPDTLSDDCLCEHNHL